jgi:hypothetical protein
MNLNELLVDSTNLEYCPFCDEDVLLYDGIHCERCENDLLHGIPQEVYILVGDSKPKCIGCNGQLMHYLMCEICDKFNHFYNCFTCKNTSKKRGECKDCDSTFKNMLNPRWELEKNVFIKYCETLLFDEERSKLMSTGIELHVAEKQINKQKINLKANELWAKKIQKIGRNIR